MILSKINYIAKIKILSLIFICTSTIASACDICGCFMGITPHDTKNHFAILYRYRAFNGYDGQNHNVFPKGSSFFFPAKNQNQPITDHNGNPNDYEIYRSMELRGKYFINKKIEINAIIPYVSNSEQYNGYTTTVAGLGDVNIYAGYHLLQLYNSDFKQQLIVGLGIKLPTGKNNLKNNEGFRYSSLMQNGTRSTDGFIYLNYMLGYNNFGASLNTSYKVNGNNNRDEGISNSNSNFLNIFYRKAINKNWQVIPALQFFYEYSAGETYKNVQTGEHKMNNLMAGPGADILYKNLVLNLGIQKNIWEGETDHPKSAGKAYMGLTYNF